MLPIDIFPCKCNIFRFFSSKLNPPVEKTGPTSPTILADADNLISKRVIFNQPSILGASVGKSYIGTSCGSMK